MTRRWIGLGLEINYVSPLITIETLVMSREKEEPFEQHSEDAGASSTFLNDGDDNSLSSAAFILCSFCHWATGGRYQAWVSNYSYRFIFRSRIVESAAHDLRNFPSRPPLSSQIKALSSSKRSAWRQKEKKSEEALK